VSAFFVRTQGISVGNHYVSYQNIEGDHYIRYALCMVALLLQSCAAPIEPATAFSGESAPAPAQTAASETHRYRMTAGFGYTVCEAFLKNLNAFPVADPPMVCEVRIHPDHGQFKRVEWEELPIKDNLRLAYAAAIQVSPAPSSAPSFELWSKELLALLDGKEFVPWLRKARLALNERGPETLISFQRDSQECETHQLGGGGHIFVLKDESRAELEPIKGAVGSDLDTDVVIYRGKPFFSFTAAKDSGWALSLHPVHGASSSGNGQYVIAQGRCEYQFDK
jgi:hypothetical protein